MTVAELIEKLKTYDPSRQVYGTYEGCFVKISPQRIEEEKYNEELIITIFCEDINL